MKSRWTTTKVHKICNSKNNNNNIHKEVHMLVNYIRRGWE
jgi:hypothetical protein